MYLDAVTVANVEYKTYYRRNANTGYSKVAVLVGISCVRYKSVVVIVDTECR